MSDINGSNTNVENFDPNKLVDLFPDLGGPAQASLPTPKFALQEYDSDILGGVKPSPTPSPAPSDPAVPAPAATPEPPKNEKPLEEADVLGAGKPAPVEGKVISDLQSYYEDRINSGKFVKIEMEDEKGNVVPFIPKTAEEYDEVIELQIANRVAKAQEEMERSWFESKSPAWKVVSKYAELTDDPAELIPIIQGVRTIQSVADLDENDLEGAEKIVRTRLEQKGDPVEIIASQIEALKTTDKLIPTAKQYKPIIIQQESQIINQRFKEQEEQEKQYRALVYDIKQKAVEEIEKPIFGKNKLKSEEKAAIYDLIAEPLDAQGYGIYTAIDQLFEKRDFQTLRELALLLTKKESFYNYLGISVAEKTAAGLQNKLRVAGESRTASGNDFSEERATIQRNQYKNTKPSFGRG